MGKESSERIQTSLLNRIEKKALIWLAKRQPHWMTSDMLTYIGVVGSAIYAIFSFFGHYNDYYLWLACLGLVIHWYGDSLDGTIARVRNTQRPIYGFFIDHTLDAATTCIICLGLGISPIVSMDVALLILAGYLSLSIFTYVTTIVENQFRLTYGKLGPTEVRLILIVVNVLYIYTPWRNIGVYIKGHPMTVFDFIGLAIAIILFILFAYQFLCDRKKLSEQDPKKNF